MDYKSFILGLSLLLIGYLIYRTTVRGKKPLTSEKDASEMSPRIFVSMWWVVIMCFLIGIWYVIESLPS